MSKFSNSFPLGGTSNHFVTKILKSAKGWRAENVTEDAELGCRLSTYGYNALMLDCPTLEEAVNCHLSFIRQRSRWIKGYMQTLFCNIEHLFQFKYYNNINITIFHTAWFFISIILPFVFISNIVNVFIHYVTLTSMSSKVLFFEHNNLYDIWLYIGLDIVFRYILIRKANLKSNNILNITFQSVQFIVLYFVSYLKAMFEIIFIPSYWDKTNHIGTYSVSTKQ